MGHQADPDAGALQHRTLGRFETGLVAANRAIIVIMMVGMVGLVFINVLSRYLLNTSIVWAEELSQFLMCQDEAQTIFPATPQRTALAR